MGSNPLHHKPNNQVIKYIPTQQSQKRGCAKTPRKEASENILFLVSGSTRNGDDAGCGEILLSSHSLSEKKPSHAMGAASREPRRGESPMRLIRCQPLDDFPVFRGVENK